MKKFKSELKLFSILLLTSAVLYYIHYSIFKDFHHISLYFMEDLAFIPVEVVFVSLIIHRFITYGDKKRTQSKLNMIVGVFYSKFGTDLLSLIAKSDKNISSIKDKLIVDNSLTKKEFIELKKTANSYEPDLEIDFAKAHEILAILSEERTFLVELLANPSLLEKESFSNLLLSIFHLREEMCSRKNISSISPEDEEHLSIDISRAYKNLIVEWVKYIEHLKDVYPYLYSYALRTNPFDADASVEF